MTENSLRFQDFIPKRQEVKNNQDDKSFQDEEKAMSRLFIEASSDEEIQKIERWLLR